MKKTVQIELTMEEAQAALATFKNHVIVQDDDDSYDHALYVSMRDKVSNAIRKAEGH